MRNKKITTALEYYDLHLFSLNIKLENDEITIEQYRDAREDLYYKCKLLERKQILNASKTGYVEAKINSEGGDAKYRGAQDYYNKKYGVLNINGSNGN